MKEQKRLKYENKLNEAIKALEKLGNEGDLNTDLELIWREKFDYNEFSGKFSKKRDKNSGHLTKEVDKFFTDDPCSIYMEALTAMIVKLSYELKMSRYSILEAIKLNIENNY